MGRHKKEINPVEYLTVFTDVTDLSGKGRKYWVDFVVPTDWLLNFLGLRNPNDISYALASYSVDKERVLIAAIEDGVVEYGW